MLNGIILGARGLAVASLLIFLSLAVNSPPAWSALGGKSCSGCAQLVKAHKPFRIYGNTWFVGTEGLGAILVTSEYGHVLIDAGLPESAPLIKASIEALGFRITDVKGIVSSGAYPEYSGGIAELQRLSGAQVYALREAESVLSTGKLKAEDPRSADKSVGIAPVPFVSVLQDDQLLGVGSLRLRVMATPGATPGGASWSWESCESGTCLNFVYAGNLAPATAGKYRFKDHPDVLQDFEGSFQRLEKAQCDVLLTARPKARSCSSVWIRMAVRGPPASRTTRDAHVTPSPPAIRWQSIWPANADREGLSSVSRRFRRRGTAALPATPGESAPPAFRPGSGRCHWHPWSSTAR